MYERLPIDERDAGRCLLLAEDPLGPPCVMELP